MTKEYKSEEDRLTKEVTVLHASKVPQTANIISSKTLYKIKVGENGELELKARIDPHGNEDSLKQQFRYDCSPCAPTGTVIILSLATLIKLYVNKADVRVLFYKLVGQIKMSTCYLGREVKKRISTYGNSKPLPMDWLTRTQNGKVNLTRY